MMIELEIDKESSFTLEMKIDGDAGPSSGPPQMRFSIVSEGFTFSVPAIRVENGVYEVNCPRLKGILKPGEYDVNVEVFIDDKHFVPLSDKILIKEELKPVVKLTEKKKPVTVNEMSISVNVKPLTESVPTPSLTKTDDIVSL